MTGSVDCSIDRCGPLELQAELVGDLVVSNQTSRTPLKLTARHVSSISVVNSQLYKLPWPGFYFYNVSQVLLTGNVLKNVEPRSVHVTNVGHLNISHNILNDIRKDVLGNLTSLSVLDISHNKLPDTKVGDILSLFLVNNVVLFLSYSFVRSGGEECCPT